MTSSELRDRDSLPSLPCIPWSVAAAAYPEMDAPKLRGLLNRANNLAAALRSLSRGGVGCSSAPEGVSWKAARDAQRRLSMNMLSAWAGWQCAMDAAPAPVDAYQRSLGSTNVSYVGVLETEPEDGQLDSAGRPLLPKGAICPIDVKESLSRLQERPQHR